MPRVRIDLAYDGAEYAGFARQPDQRTVQGDLEDALDRLCATPGTRTVCAGRTDRGVHALAQVVHVDVPDGLDVDGLSSRLGAMLGDAISVWSAVEVDPSFDARFSARERAYRYRLAPRPADPRTRGHVWHVRGPLDARAMAAELPALHGEHDFASFCRRAEGGHTRRRLDEVVLHDRPDGQLHVVLRGPAFCHQMVRSIVGSLVEVGRSRRGPGFLDAALAARDRAAAGPVAPPHGLTLERVGYPYPWPDAPARG